MTMRRAHSANSTQASKLTGVTPAYARLRVWSVEVDTNRADASATNSSKHQSPVERNEGYIT